MPLLFNFNPMNKIVFAFVVLAIVLLAFRNASDPLKNTKWEGENGLVFYFTPSDTVKLIINDKLLSSALYKVKDSVLTWRDFIVSDATCDTSIRGQYVYKIKDSILTFRTISDRCEDRANVLQTLVLIRK